MVKIFSLMYVSTYVFILDCVPYHCSACTIHRRKKCHIAFKNVCKTAVVSMRDAKLKTANKQQKKKSSYYGIRPPIVNFTIGEVNIDRASFISNNYGFCVTRENLFSFYYIQWNL